MAAPPAPPPSLPARHPAMIAAALAVASCIAISVSFRINDPDLWQHLAVGRAIWTTHAIPHTNLWTWPTYGVAQVLPSWGFRALLWPFWAAGGSTGLLAWRVVTALIVFALAWATARRMGARGFTALLVLALCALVYRKRSEVRPESLAAVLLALEIWILEQRRAGGPDRAPWLIAIACAWVNVHISWPIGLIVLGIHAAADRFSRGTRPAVPAWRRLELIWIAALAASFLNPFGWQALWQPFDYQLHLRHEPLFRLISELQPVQWPYNLRNGLPLLVAAWPVLLAWRARVAGFDPVETAMLVLFLPLALSAQRFVGFFAVAAAPYLARDLAAILDAGRRSALERPPRLGSPGARAALVSIACVALSLPEWTASRTAFGPGLDLSQTPVGACDFVARHGVRGHAFNPFHYGGYLLWRFWPDRDRLPFVDIHQTGTPEDRALLVGAMANADGVRALLDRHDFEWALLDRQTPGQVGMLDAFDADSAWARVFVDDAAALYVRRGGPLAAVADSFAFQAWPAGFGAIGEVYRRCARDPAFRARVELELDRQIGSSRYCALAHDARADLALIAGHDADAEHELRAALAVSPRVLRAHARLGLIALHQGHPREALRQFDLEHRDDPNGAQLEVPIAGAWRALGDTEKARAWYRKALERNPDDAVARDSLSALEGNR